MVVVMSPEELDALIRRAVREELARAIPAKQTDDLVTEEQAADRLHVSVRTIQRMVRSGQIQSIMVRGARRLQIADLLRCAS